MGMGLVDRSKVRQYFFGKSNAIALLLIVIGLITLVWVIGIFLILAGLIWILYNKFSADEAGQSEADKAKEIEIQLARERAMDKLNLVQEQVMNIEPVVTCAAAYEPNSPTSQTVAAAGKYGKFFKSSIVRNSDDPIFAWRVGSDKRLRYSLTKITVFMFGEQQLYIYYANVDLTTGLVYDEGTHELFYQDINAVSFKQIREKIFNIKRRKFERHLLEYVSVYTSGCSYTAGISTDMNNSVLESQFTGMRNLIRDKKNES